MEDLQVQGPWQSKINHRIIPSQSATESAFWERERGMTRKWWVYGHNCDKLERRSPLLNPMFRTWNLSFDVFQFRSCYRTAFEFAVQLDANSRGTYLDLQVTDW